MRKIILIVAILLPGIVLSDIDLEIPDEFTVTKRLFSFTTDFDVETETNELGYIHRKVIGPIMRYDLYDAQGDILATAKMRFAVFGAVAVVTDTNNNLIGTVEEQVVNYFESFNIIDAEGEKQIVGALNFMGTNYVLTDPVTEIHVGDFSYISWKFFMYNNIVWKMRLLVPEVFHAKKIDPRLYIIAMGIHSDRDEWRKKLPKHRPHQPIDDKSYESEVTKTDFQTVEDSFDRLYECLTFDAKTDEEKYELGMELVQQLLESEDCTVGQKAALRALLSIETK